MRRVAEQSVNRSSIPIENERATVHGSSPPDPFLAGNRTIDFQTPDLTQ